MNQTYAGLGEDGLVIGAAMFEQNDTAAVEIRYRRIRVLPPIGKQKRYPALELTVLHAQERDEPDHRSRIDWKLISVQKTMASASSARRSA